MELTKSRIALLITLGVVALIGIVLVVVIFVAGPGGSGEASNDLSSISNTLTELGFTSQVVTGGEDFSQQEELIKSDLQMYYPRRFQEGWEKLESFVSASNEDLATVVVLKFKNQDGADLYYEYMNSFYLKMQMLQFGMEISIFQDGKIVGAGYADAMTEIYPDSHEIDGVFPDIDTGDASVDNILNVLKEQYNCLEMGHVQIGDKSRSETINETLAIIDYPQVSNCYYGLSVDETTYNMNNANTYLIIVCATEADAEQIFALTNEDLITGLLASGMIVERNELLYGSILDSVNDFTESQVGRYIIAASKELHDTAAATAGTNP